MSNDHKNHSTGTARILHELCEYEMLELEYGKETAENLTTKAIQREFHDIDKRDVQGFVKVARAAQTGKFDIAQERQFAEELAQKAADDMIKQAVDGEASEASQDDFIVIVHFNEEDE
jgi:hypothetical protein